MAQTLPTQDLLEVERIERDALVLRNGGLRKILIVSGLNFELRSEEEQTIILAGYQSFLNALSFPLQIFIHSRKINIDSYVEELGLIQQKESNGLLGALVGEYRSFIASLVSQNPIMEKRFFAVVPYQPLLPLPEVGKMFQRGILGFFKKSSGEEATLEAPPKENTIDQNAFTQLDQRTDQVVSGLSQIGLRAIPLNKDELTELFYNLYNPETVERHVIAS